MTARVTNLDPPTNLDPLGPTERLDRSRVEGAALGALLSLATHLGAVGIALSPWVPGIMTEAVAAPNLVVVDIDDEPPVAPDPAPPPEAAEEEPVAEKQDAAEAERPPPAPRPPASEPEASTQNEGDDDEPPPAPSEAIDVLTADDDGVVDLAGGGWEIVDGAGRGPAHGYQAAEGTANQTTHDRRARVGGVQGGQGAGEPRGARSSGSDRSRAAGITGGSSWSCPFPAAADVAQVNRATATILVTVQPDGRPAAVVIVSDPGYGFGQAARRCALRRRYQPAKDQAGEPMAALTPPITVRFRR